MKKISVKRLMVLSVFVLILGAIFLYIPNLGDKEKGEVKVATEKADLRINDFHYTEVGDPDLTWEIKASTASYVKKKEVTIFEDVRVRLLLSNGDVYVITADSGVLNTATKNMEVSGNVVVIGEDGASFETDNLEYSNNDGDGIIYTKDHVIMTRSYINVSGKGMRLYLKSRKMHLLSDVRAVIDR